MASISMVSKSLIWSCLSPRVAYKPTEILLEYLPDLDQQVFKSLLMFFRCQLVAHHYPILDHYHHASYYS